MYQVTSLADAIQEFNLKNTMPDTEIEIFAKFVREKRTALGMSIADLSEEVFNDRKNNYLHDLENGRRKGITIDMMGKILTALKTKISYNEL